MHFMLKVIKICKSAFEKHLKDVIITSLSIVQATPNFPKYVKFYAMSGDNREKSLVV